MPFLKIQTNHPVDEATGQDLLGSASRLVSAQLGKPENYVMVALAPPQPMMFAGTTDPLAYLELKSIGLSESRTGELSAALCGLIEEKLNINKQRIYIEFADAARAMWGWDGRTF